MQNNKGLLGNISNAFGGRQGLLSAGLPMMFGGPQMQQQALMQGLQYGGTMQAENRKTQQAQAQRNKTLEYLQQNNPELAALMEAGMSGSEALGLAYKAQQPPQAEKPTSAIQNYNFAREQGYDGSFVDWQTAQKKAGAHNVTVNNQNPMPGLSKLGEGMSYLYNPDGSVKTDERGIPMSAPIQGTKAGIAAEEAERKRVLAEGNADTATRIITSAASRAREAAGQRALGGFGQSIVQMNPYTDSAEVARQVEVLKSNAKVENLTAMRAASPTGGALGSVTEKEAQMLADKSGALDPSSPNFARDLDDYELSLLQVIHGPEDGMRIFQQTRTRAPDTGGGEIDALVEQYAD